MGCGLGLNWQTNLVERSCGKNKSGTESNTYNVHGDKSNRDYVDNIFDDVNIAVLRTNVRDGPLSDKLFGDIIKSVLMSL